MATPEEIVENAKTTASCLNSNIERCKTGQSNAYSSYRQRFTGKDSHITEERISYKKSNGTEIKLPLYNEKSVDTSPEPSGWIAFVSPSGIKYLPTYSQTNGNMGSKGRYSNIAENRGHVCNLCFSNCNTNYANCAKCYTGCNDPCYLCQGCQSCNSCDSICNSGCHSCNECLTCTKCNMSNSDCSGCYGKCYDCNSCNQCHKCNECQGSCYGCYGCNTCDGGCDGCNATCYQVCHGCVSNECSGCVGSHKCRSSDGGCCNSGGEPIGVCNSCDGHCANGSKSECGVGKISPTCTSQGTYTPCANNRCNNYSCHGCYSCNSCQQCNTHCYGACVGGCHSVCQSCNDCLSCNSTTCKGCYGCRVCQTCNSCQSCNSNCYEANS